ncbi:hypothetical protein ES675_09615 [Bizionia algoritergicola]|uniref:DUF4293 family protein n=1 Tax=Bizionia algoritergicola TaxID=291187 RepID=A0A5D0QXP4_9FLAO|nr:DUF6326 family protein [Bizionia sp. APA-3]TYB72994.1 hypothetical protein ES675_09615 [Bizionia algoritergicola]
MRLENPTINIKLKLAALWASVTFCYLYGDYFELYTPGKIDSLLTGKNILDSPISLLIASIILAIPSIMVLGSHILKPKLNRILNFLFGSIFTLMLLFIAVNSLTAMNSFYVFFAILESIITSLIIWYYWSWPRIN